MAMADNKGLATDPSMADAPLAEKRQTAAYWRDTIIEREKSYEEWNSQVDNMLKHVYSSSRLANDSREREMQVAWANMEVLKPAIYVNPPRAAVASRYKDRKPLIRHGAEIMERCISTAMDTEDLHETLLTVRNDLVDCSRGVLWLRLDTNAVGQQIVGFDHVDRRDFLHSAGRTWKEVWWVARRVYMDADQLEQRFGPVSGDLWRQCELNKQGEDLDDEDMVGDQQAEIWEVWDKSEGKVCWLCCDGCEDYLDVSLPPVSLKNYFPCPKPAYGTTEATSLKPVPHFLYIKDQIEEIDELTARISALSENLRLKGFYAAGAEDISDALERILEDTENRATLVPVPATAMLSGQSLKDSIVWLPIEEVAQVIAAMVELRKQLISDIYEITGISDIMRGTSAAQETATAQEIKAQYGSIRIKKMQQEMVRIAKDAAEMCGEIIAENFEPDLIKLMSQYDGVKTAEERSLAIQQLQMQVEKAKADPNIMQQAQQNPEMAQQMVSQVQAQIDELMAEPTFEMVVNTLREQRLRPYMIDIETDSTIMADENLQKQRMSEFMTSLGNSLQQLSAMVAADPRTVDFAGEVLKFSVSPFRVGRELDSTIDDLIDKMKEPKQEGPTPEQQMIELQGQQLQADVQLKQSELQIKQQELAIKQKEAEVAGSADMQKMQAEMQKAQADLQKAQADMALKNQEIRDNRLLKQAEMALKRDIEEAKIDLDGLGLQVELAKIASTSEGAINQELSNRISALIDEANVDPEIVAEMKKLTEPKPDPVMDKLEELSVGSQMSSQAIAEMMERMNAPKQVMRDENGQVVGIQSGEGQRSVVRDENGNIVGLQ